LPAAIADRDVTSVDHGRHRRFRSAHRKAPTSRSPSASPPFGKRPSSAGHSHVAGSSDLAHSMPISFWRNAPNESVSPSHRPAALCRSSKPFRIPSDPRLLQTTRGKLRLRLQSGMFSSVFFPSRSFHELLPDGTQSHSRFFTLRWAKFQSGRRIHSTKQTALARGPVSFQSGRGWPAAWRRNLPALKPVRGRWFWRCPAGLRRCRSRFEIARALHEPLEICYWCSISACPGS